MESFYTKSPRGGITQLLLECVEEVRLLIEPTVQRLCVEHQGLKQQRGENLSSLSLEGTAEG